MAQDSNRPPEVTNVVAQQVGQQVEISYDLIDRDGDLMTVSLRVSSDGGSNFDLAVISVEGEIGERIASGKGKTIIWHVEQDIPDFYSTNVVFEVVTDDGRGPEIITWEKDGSEMVLIPSGSFEMGDHFNEGVGKTALGDELKFDELPVHEVTLDEFYIDIYEVTVGQFKQFVNQSGYNYSGKWDKVEKSLPGDEYPMSSVNWNDAVAYATWAGKRLPTEAEWEYAARGGLVGKRYPWGDEISHDNANYSGTGGKDKWSGYAPVGSFEANGYGLYDMAGNLREWCADWYDSDYYSKSPAKNPLGPDSQTRAGYRVMRGGFYGEFAAYQRVAFRTAPEPDGDGRSHYVGFRCVVSGLN